MTGDGVEVGRASTRSASLVAKSMVTAEDASGGATRYQLLETMRQYALDRIDERGEVERGDAGTRRTTQRAPRRPGWA